MLIATWDGKDYLSIAEHGYSPSVAAGNDRSVAFFPGYPMILRGAHFLTGLNVPALAVPVSVAAGIAFAYGLTQLLDGRAGLVLVALVAVSPMSAVLLMAYTEALFCAFAAWTLVAIQHKRWLTAGLLASLAGTVRPTALALIVALAIGVILARPRVAWRPLLALTTAPVGALIYLGWADRFTGAPFAWLHAERNGWGARFDFGRWTIWRAYRGIMFGAGAIEIVTTVALLAAAWGLYQLCRRRLWLLLGYASVVWMLDLGTASMWESKVRLLLPAFPVLIPVAQWIATQRRGRSLLIAAALFGAWYSMFGLVSFGYAI